MFDRTSITAQELLSHFGKNTGVTVRHMYNGRTIDIVSARTRNVIATVDIAELLFPCDVAVAAFKIMGQNNFPKPRNTKRAWSRIVLNQIGQRELDFQDGLIAN